MFTIFSVPPKDQKQELIPKPNHFWGRKNKRKKIYGKAPSKKRKERTL
jgi:hypothetical protein